MWPDPQSSWAYRDRAPSLNARERAESVYRRLTAMDGSRPKRFRFGDYAQELFVVWLTELESSLVSDSLDPVMQATWQNTAPLCPRSHYCLRSQMDAREKLNLRHAQQAASFCEYLKPHARRIYSANSPQRNSAILLAKRLRAGLEGEREASFQPARCLLQQLGFTEHS